MAGDVAGYLREVPIDDPRFAEGFARQAYVRNLSEAAIINVGPDRQIRTHAVVNPYDRPFERIVTARGDCQSDRQAKRRRSTRRTGSARLRRSVSARGITSIRPRVFDPAVSRADQPRRRGAERLSRAARAVARQPAAVQWRAAGSARWSSSAWRSSSRSKLADRLVRPVGQLVAAAGRIEEGDFSTRVPVAPSDDEIATLGTAFNRMTGRLQEQTGALMAANSQLDTRRAFIEAVLSSVTAGVIALDDEQAHPAHQPLGRSLAPARPGTGRGQPCCPTCRPISTNSCRASSARPMC